MRTTPPRMHGRAQVCVAPHVCTGDLRSMRPPTWGQQSLDAHGSLHACMGELRCAGLLCLWVAQVPLVVIDFVFI